jgi:hypothetical protein
MAKLAKRGICINAIAPGGNITGPTIPIDGGFF